MFLEYLVKNENSEKSSAESTPNVEVDIDPIVHLVESFGKVINVLAVCLFIFS